MQLGHEIVGTGDTKVLMMHDWSCCTSTYDQCRPYLNTTEFTYAFVDLRGYGKSIELSGNFSVEEASSDILETLEALGWNEFHIVGHSMTGMVAQRITLDAPDKVKSLIVTCAVSASGMPMDEEGWAFFVETTLNDEAYIELMRGVCMDKLSNGWLTFKMERNRVRSTPESRIGYLNMFSKTDFSSEVSSIFQPILVITGSNDTESLNADAMQQTFLSQHVNTDLIDIEGCGHYPMQECPPNFVSIVESFFSRTRTDA